MKFINTLLLFSFLSSSGQLDKFKLINSQTNSYIFYSGDSYDIKRQQRINYFYLVSADKDKITEKHIRVYTDKKSKLFLDSLKSNGFKKYANSTNLTDKCKFTMTLNSTSIHRVDGIDTIFRFILLVNLNKENGDLIVTSDTIFGDMKQEILDAIENKKFSVRVDKINQTKLIDVTINSLLLTNPYSKALYSGGSAYSIYLADKN